MTQPELAQMTESGRMYSRQLGEPAQVPSITTVIGMQSPKLDGWAGYMAARAMASDVRLPQALKSAGAMRDIIRDAANAAETFREEAAARGDRVHYYAEQCSRRELGLRHDAEVAREQLQAHGEEGFARSFEQWWSDYDPQPLVPEITVWNQSLGYAGTLDLVAEIGGKRCIIDFKTRGTTRQGEVKPIDPKVALQLVAGLKAEEQLVDARTGSWEPWEYHDAEILVAVGLGDSGYLSVRVNPQSFPAHWYKFAALRRVWERDRELSAEGTVLLPLGAPPAR